MPDTHCCFQTPFGTTVRIVEHWVATPQNNINTLTHRNGLQHLHYLLMGATQNTRVANKDQDVSWRRAKCNVTELQVHFYRNIADSIPLRKVDTVLLQKEKSFLQYYRS